MGRSPLSHRKHNDLEVTMEINFGKSIRDALGLGKQHVETEGDLSARDAALAKKKEGGSRGTATTFPTGYARSQRRIRRRVRAADLNRRSRQSMRIARQREDDLNTAGALARIYFNVVPASLVHKRDIDARVERQARSIMEYEGIRYDKAIDKVEAAMRESMEALDALQASKMLADQKRKAGTKRAKARFSNPDAVMFQSPLDQHRVAMDPFGTPMPH